ncbi:MAG: hypothetical protein KJ698_02290 [Actinobacteria bacterium]|nr:hypothetical protein [Actinomycetota bacterium]MBU1865685.1 hypothetical protein [Actinomycetota bacterium]
MPRHRMIYLTLAAALTAVVAAAVVLAPSGEETSVPAPLESIFPAPGDTVVRQTIIEIDLPVGYSIDLYIDGVWVPTDEIGFTPSTGVFRWQPSPGASLDVWAGGEHTVRVVWDRTAGGRPDPGEYEWAFRVQ